ncbi:armadillo-type protein [Mycotypha africana]|uniref:armadillo-type protein n=1 Tax=Mycotypha africana TaxID=64632 RepID=UPI0023012574|nr:armadillo-type protein [Mycotypha africana]KAI8970253.1 armadillo-type protein [Mycotypha africana]
MDYPTVTQVETLINELYSSSDPLVAKEIQDQLQTLQKQPIAWEIASQLLFSQTDHCRFFGAHTFQVKITRDWETLPENKHEWLKSELLNWIVRLCGGPAFVTTKLCIALIAYSFHSVPDKWPHFIASTVEALQLGSQAYGVPAQTIYSTILEFLTLVPEEISNSNLIGGHKLQLIGELKEGVPIVLTTISTLLFQPVNSADTLQHKSLRCLQSWIQYGINLEDAHTLLQKVMILLGHPELFEPAVDVLLESMQQTAWARYQNYRNELLSCFTSDAMKEKFETCIADEDEETALALAKLFTTFGETYTDFIVKHLARPDIKWLLQMILQLTDYKGYYPIDQEVSEIPLNFWYIMQETLFDENVLPLRPISTPPHLDEGNSRDEAVWIYECGQTSLAIYRDLVKILIQKACYPDEMTWNSWNKDVKDKFKIWRRDLGDTMINPYFVLKDEMLSILLEQATCIIEQWEGLPNSAQYLEATLFCLKSISEEISAKESVYISRFFGAEILGKLQSDCSIRLKNTVLLLMGSFSEWLKSNPQLLNPIMNYIVPCLSNPNLAPAATSSFSDICDNCRESLVDELESLMHVYVAMANSSIKSIFMQKVVQSVADVIQVLPPERAIPPLMSLTGDILQGISKALNLIEENPEGSRDATLVQLQYLTACCRGIQSPNDDYKSLTERDEIYDAFASGKLTKAYMKIDGFSDIAFAIEQSTARIARVWGADEAIAKALSTFVDQGIKSTSPLLSLSFVNFVELVEASYTTAAYACWLDSAALAMTVFGGQGMYTERLRDMLGTLTTKTLEVINGTEAMENYPDIVDSYFGLLSRTLRRCPLAFYHLPLSMINMIFLIVIAGLGLQERLALKAAVMFMADFVTQDHPDNSDISEVADTIMMNLGIKIMEQLLLGIGGRVPRSFSGPLVDVLHRITGKYLQPSREWLRTLLATDGFPSPLVTPEDKEALLKGVLGNRSLKRFKETVNNFSIKCRGLGNTTFGKV